MRPSLVLAAVATVAAFATAAVTHAYYADGELTAWPFSAGSLDLRVRMPGSATWTDDATTPTLGSLWDSSTGAFKPGESYTFDIDVRNDGSVDGVADFTLTAIASRLGTRRNRSHCRTTASSGRSCRRRSCTARVATTST